MYRIILVIIILCGNFLPGAENREIIRANSELRSQQMDRLQKARDEKNCAQCEAAIAGLFGMVPDMITPESERRCATTLSRACNMLYNNFSYTPVLDSNTAEKLRLLGLRYVEEFLQMEFHDPKALDEQWSALWAFKDHLMLKSSALQETPDAKTEEFRQERKRISELIIRQWNRLEAVADREWKLEDHADEYRMVLNTTGSSYTPRHYNMGFPPRITINDDTKREAYLERKLELHFRSRAQEEAIKIQRDNEITLIEYLATYYLIPPHDVEELETLLAALKDPFGATVKILEPVKKQAAWVAAGWRPWQTSDGIFQVTARFISLAKGDVTLEREDGKQTTIELSALRQEDQDYVKRQSQPPDAM